MGRAFDTGSGFLAGRLKVQGLPYEWVSDPAIAMPGADGVDRIDGLLMDSIAFGESIDPGTGELQTDGMNAQIVEDPQHRTGDMFVMLPQRVAYLTASVTSVTTTVTLDPPIFNDADVIHLGTEAMLVTAGGGTGSLTVARAYRGTTAQAHFVDPSLGLPPAEITDRPVGITGRRAEFYTYEPEDSVFGLGTLRWRGIVAIDPTQNDPSTWTILIDPPTSALDQDLSADSQDGVQPRGISYSSRTPVVFEINESLTANLSSNLTGTVTARFTFPAGGVAAFWETQQAYLNDLNAALIVATAGFDHPLTTTNPALVASESVTGAWDLTYTPDAVDPRYLIVRILGSQLEQLTPGDGLETYTGLLDIAGESTSSVAAGTSYLVPRTAGISGAGTVPRGVFGYDGGAGLVGNAQVMYLGGFATGTSAQSLLIEWPAANGLPESTDFVAVDAYTAATRSISGTSESLFGLAGRFYTSESLPLIKIGRVYAGGNLADLLVAIVTLAPENANAGSCPFIDSNDFNLPDMAANVDAITLGRPWVNRRVFATYATANLLKMTIEELKLLGATYAMTTSGQITVRELLVRAATDPDAVAIGEDEILSGAGGEWPTFERQALGSLNTLILKTGYNASVDEWTGRTFRLRDIASYARQHTTRSITIEPLSYFYGGDSAIDISDVTALAQAYFGLLGAPYSIVQAKVPLTRFGVLIGDGVTVTCSTLPNPDTGGRGIVDAPGIVIGRKWELMRGTGMMRILVPHQRVAGYSPSSRVASNAIVSGTTYDLTLELAQPRGYATASSWIVGDTIRTRRWNALTPASAYGTVSAVNTATRVIRVVLAAAIPSGTLNLGYGFASSATTSQRRYMYVADFDRQISFSTATAPRTFGA